MKIRLKITGGFAGPAAWQDIVLDDSHPEFPELMKSVQAAARTQATESSRSRGTFPDGQDYTIELDGDQESCTVSGADGTMSDEFRDMVQLIKRCGRANGEKKEEEEKESGEE